MPAKIFSNMYAKIFSIHFNIFLTVICNKVAKIVIKMFGCSILCTIFALLLFTL